MLVREQDIGGGFVRRLFNRGAEALRAGTPMTREEILEIPANNRQSLIDNGYLQIYPPRPGDLGAQQRHVVSRGFGNYNVIVGTILNDKPLTKNEARILAGLGADEEPDETPN